MTDRTPPTSKPVLPVAITLGVIVLIAVILIGPQFTNHSREGKVPDTPSATETPALPAQSSPIAPPSLTASPVPLTVPPAVEPGKTLPDSAQVKQYLGWLQRFNAERRQSDTALTQEIQQQKAQFEDRITGMRASMSPAQMKNFTDRIETRLNAQRQRQYKGMASAFMQTHPPASCAKLHATYLRWLNVAAASMGKNGTIDAPDAGDRSNQKQQKLEAEKAALENQLKQLLATLRAAYPQPDAELFNIAL